MVTNFFTEFIIKSIESYVLWRPSNQILPIIINYSSIRADHPDGTSHGGSTTIVKFSVLNYEVRPVSDQCINFTMNCIFFLFVIPLGAIKMLQFSTSGAVSGKTLNLGGTLGWSKIKNSVLFKITGKKNKK